MPSRCLSRRCLESKRSVEKFRDAIVVRLYLIEGTWSSKLKVKCHKRMVYFYDSLRLLTLKETFWWLRPTCHHEIIKCNSNVFFFTWDTNHICSHLSLCFWFGFQIFRKGKMARDCRLEISWMIPRLMYCWVNILPQTDKSLEWKKHFFCCSS